jgi:DNA polymerase-3 subunit epsilon
MYSLAQSLRQITNNGILLTKIPSFFFRYTIWCANVEDVTMLDTLTGILNWNVHESPMAVIDLETTGLTPGFDRIVEISVIRLEPPNDPCIVLDTLVNPRRAMAATEIHGITDDDVADAPTFKDIAGDLICAISECPVAAHNVHFDMSFLSTELQQVGVEDVPPHVCLMNLRPMLDMGPRCTLENACHMYGIPFDPNHTATQDAAAAAQLWQFYLEKMKNRGIHTFGELAQIKGYHFTDSFTRSPFPASLAVPFSNCKNLKTRNNNKYRPTRGLTPSSENPEAAYWDALKTALSDLEITDEEITELLIMKENLQMEDEQIWAIHAKVFIGVLSQFVVDNYLDEQERRVIQRLHHCLSTLGWAPGEA